MGGDVTNYLNATQSGGERSALQALRAVRGHPAVAKRLDCACLQHRFPDAGEEQEAEEGEEFRRLFRWEC